MAQTEVILCEKIDGLGAEADVVTVKAGYARNFLIPYGKAYEATKENLAHIEELKAARAQREAQELEKAQQLSSSLKSLTLSFSLETGETGKTFGSITNRDIQKKLEDEGFEIDRHAIQLKEAIKTSGDQEISIKLHPEITSTLRISVNSEQSTPVES